jgi:predicted 3-demethylubiquinone-9 3-methyltransferase (glyoxalase superfamily)
MHKRAQPNPANVPHDLRDKAAAAVGQKLPQLCPLTHAAHGKGTSKRATFFSIGCRFHMPLFDKIRRASPLNSYRSMEMVKKNTICLWYDGTALDAARFYAETFPDSAVGAVMRAPGDYPDGKQGDVLTVEFTVAGIPCIGLNGGPQFKHNEAFSFQIATDDQAETDRLWNAIVGNGGEESACGWCKDKWGLNWQITPRVLIDAISDPDRAAAKRAFEAMMKMRKIEIAAIEAARRG